jgi:hypothetical protein
MSKKPNAVERNRLTYINHLMEEVNSATTQVYEHFVDKEYNEAKHATYNLIKRLKEVIQSLEDEV